MSAGHNVGRLVTDDRLLCIDGVGVVAIADDMMLGEADARRLAACWNACEGMDTDKLEKLPAPFSTLLSSEFLDLVDQMAAARALLAEVMDAIDQLRQSESARCADRIRAFLAGGGA